MALTLTMTIPTFALDAALAGLTAVDVVLLRAAQGRIPRLYESGVVYRREPAGQDNWASVVEVLGAGWGDCEDLACWRAAELNEYDGELARAVAIQTGRARYHAVVCRADGTLEDPSRELVAMERRLRR